MHTLIRPLRIAAGASLEEAQSGSAECLAHPPVRLRRKDAAYQEAMYLKERDKGAIVQKRRGYGKELSCDQLAQLRQDLKLAPPRPAHMDD